jgi:hypothetical protein
MMINNKVPPFGSNHRRNIAQVADELDAEIDRQAGIITRSEGVPASDVR